MGLGAWRFFLAAVVAITHLWADMWPGPAGYAVWCFFVLSGYLMTHVLTAKYGLTEQGIKAYATNRFLRIYPTYIAALALSIVSLILLPGYGIEPTKLHHDYGIPENAETWTWSLTMLYFLPRSGPVPLGVAWALFVEIAAYALMPLLAKSRSAAALAFLIGLAANLDLDFSGRMFGVRYHSLSTCMLAFAAGALVSHYRSGFRHLSAPRLSVAAWCAFALGSLAWPQLLYTYGLPLSVLPSAWVVLSLAGIKMDKADQWLGNLSYPVYLLHMVSGLWMCAVYGYDKSFAFFVASFALTLALSWLFVMLIDRRVDRIKVAPLIGSPLPPEPRGHQVSPG